MKRIGLVAVTALMTMVLAPAVADGKQSTTGSTALAGAK
jgi:hypothetical protein